MLSFFPKDIISTETTSNSIWESKLLHEFDKLQNFDLVPGLS